MGMDINFNLLTGKIKAGNHVFELLRYGPISLVSYVTARETGNLPKIYITVNGKRLLALVDSGSSITYCKSSIAREMGKAWSSINSEGKAANGSSIFFHGQFWGHFEIGDINLTSRILISNDKDCPFDLIIGTDLLEMINKMGMEIRINLAEGTISFDDSAVKLINAIPLANNLWENEGTQKIKRTIRALENIIVEPNTDNVITGKMEDEIGFFDIGSCENFLISTHYAMPGGMIVGKTLCNPKNGIFIRIFNTGNSKNQIYENQKVAIAEPITEDCEKIFVVESKETDFNEAIDYIPPEVDIANKLPSYPTDKLNNILEKLDLNESILTEGTKDELRKVILKYSEAFVGSNGDIGHYRGKFKHRIELLDPNKITQKRPYRVPPALRPEVEQQVKEMLRQKIIQPSSSPFCSPIVLVKKRDGKWRFAVDYRELNANTRKATYHLPLIQDIVDLIGGKNIFSTFDFQAGFHQLDMEPEHVERTAFATFCGFYEFLRMPFGVCGGPSSFQKMMEQLRQELSASFFVYIDDVILASLDEKEHIYDIENFLIVLINKGLKLKMEKCMFGKAEIRYLGFLIGQSGVRPDPKNIAVVQAFQVPKSLTELRSFIGGSHIL